MEGWGGVGKRPFSAFFLFFCGRIELTSGADKNKAPQVDTEVEGLPDINEETVVTLTDEVCTPTYPPPPSHSRQ